MATLNISERDFAALAEATLDAEAKGDTEQAKALDKLARKASAALTNARYATAKNQGPFPVDAIKWENVRSLLGMTSNV